MRLARYRHGDRWRFAVATADQLYPISDDIVARWPNFVSAEAIEDLLRIGESALEAPINVSLADICPPVLAPMHIMAIKSNFPQSHDRPRRSAAIGVTFQDLTAVGRTGQNGTLELEGSRHEWSVETQLAVVIGRAGRDIQMPQAMFYVLGYCCAILLKGAPGNAGDDVSAQTRLVLGPWLVTADEIQDPQQLVIRSRMHDQVSQRANTADMIFGIAELVTQMSRRVPVRPGDVLLTGAATYAALGSTYGNSAETGVRVTAGIEGLGELHTEIV